MMMMMILCPYGTRALSYWDETCALSKTMTSRMMSMTAAGSRLAPFASKIYMM